MRACARRDDLDDDIREPCRLGQPVKLLAHDVRAADRAAQYSLVKHCSQHGRLALAELGRAARAELWPKLCALCRGGAPEEGGESVAGVGGGSCGDWCGEQ